MPPIITVTGIQIREALKTWDRQKKNASRLFNASLSAFEGEQKISPTELMQQFQVADLNYAKLQDLQQDYNRNTLVSFAGETMRLSLAVKRISGAGRIEKMWNDAITEKEDRWSSNTRSRDRDTEYAARTITEKECIKNANIASRYAAAMRAAIAVANTTPMNVTTISDQEYRILFGDPDAESETNSTQSSSSASASASSSTVR